MRKWLMAAGLAWAATVQAAPYAQVDAVQAPAWVERGGNRQALVPGMELNNRDRLVTGAGARAIVQLADGSAVKLGENAQLGLNALGRREGGVFTAALDVVAGAFRLTTDAFQKFQTRRAINVRIGTVTAGIRGTDIWGKSTDQRDLVCLLEGKITVTHVSGGAAELSEPRQFYGADLGKEPGPVTSISQEELSRWAAETELQVGAASLRRGGRWAVGLATLDSEADALALYDRIAALGHGPKIVVQGSGAGSYRYEVSVTQIPSEAEARLLAARLGRELELGAPRVFRR